MSKWVGLVLSLLPFSLFTAIRSTQPVKLPECFLYIYIYIFFFFFFGLFFTQVLKSLAALLLLL